jgi:hypothetical protein
VADKTNEYMCRPPFYEGTSARSWSSLILYQTACFCYNSTQPEGSILGPLLFLLYINDLPSALSPDKLLLHADNTSILVSGINTDEIQERSKLMLNFLSQWFKSNGLSLNLRKTKVLKFDTINRDSMP